MDSSTEASRWQSVWVVVALVLIAYLAAYGLLRWSNVLIAKRVISVDSSLDTPGGGLRKLPPRTAILAWPDSSRTTLASIKNAIADPAEWCFTPLAVVEAMYWNLRVGR